MKPSRLVLFVVSLIAAISIACVPEPDGPADDTPGDDSPVDSVDVRPAALESALPLDGDVIQGEFMLTAVIDTVTEVEVRFLLDGREVGVVNESPYELLLDGCALTPGNHAYSIELIDDAGNRDFAEQWFAVEGC